MSNLATMFPDPPIVCPAWCNSHDYDPDDSLVVHTARFGPEHGPHALLQLTTHVDGSPYEPHSVLLQNADHELTMREFIALHTAANELQATLGDDDEVPLERLIELMP